MTGFNLSTWLMLLLLLALVLGFVLLAKYMFNPKLNKKKTELTNNSACKKALRNHKIRLYTDYFWSEYMRAAWVMLFFVFFIALGFALNTTITIIISLILVILSVIFIILAMKSYKEFPAKAAERLKTFEAQVTAAIEKEVSFNGDNIQSFSDKDDAFDTKPLVFSFPTGVSMISFPPLAAKGSIVSTRKLEFLILSREYFSICKGAATFDLLNPKRAAAAKQCAEAAGSGGECNEHYYSQMRNVEYDGTKECIRIIYYDDRDNAEFPCKKAAPNRKSALKALKEKLRLTERQRLQKINEHEKYEEIMDRRIYATTKQEKD